jgi:hypothetical protein
MSADNDDTAPPLDFRIRAAEHCGYWVEEQCHCIAAFTTAAELCQSLESTLTRRERMLRGPEPTPEPLPRALAEEAEPAPRRSRLRL